MKCPSSGKKDENWMGGEMESRPFVFSAGATSSGCLFESSGPGSCKHTHTHTHKYYTHAHKQVKINVRGEDRQCHRADSLQRTTSFSNFAVQFLTHLFAFSSPRPSPARTLYSFPAWSVRVTWLWRLLTRSRPRIAPYPTLSPAEPDSKTTRLLPHVSPSASLLPSHSPLFAWWRPAWDGMLPLSVQYIFEER